MAQARLRILSILVAAMVLTAVSRYTGNTQPGTGEAVCCYRIIDERTEKTLMISPPR